MRLGDLDALKDDFECVGFNDYDDFNRALRIIDNAQTVNPQKIVTIPHKLIEKLVLCVVNTVENIDWDKAIEAYKKRPQGECKTCRHRDPEDKKCDCGGQERQGCKFPVSDNYFCKFYERGEE